LLALLDLPFRAFAYYCQSRWAWGATRVILRKAGNNGPLAQISEIVAVISTLVKVAGSLSRQFWWSTEVEEVSSATGCV